jgi:signal transduction histidine kinase
MQLVRKPVAVSRRTPSIVAGLSQLAAEVQKQRTVSAVLATAGNGVLRLGMRLYAFEVTSADVVLRYLATARSRFEALQERIGQPLLGLRAPIEAVTLAREVVRERRILHRADLDLFHSFIRASTGFDPAALDGAPETAGINNGVLAPLFVREAVWGLLGVVSHTLMPDEAEAVALFSTHVGSALEVAESVDALERTNRELALCRAELAAAQKELHQKERMAALGELAAVVAHEVRNPLCVLFNSVGALEDFLRAGAPADKLGDAELFASMAAEESGRLNRIVADLQRSAVRLHRRR